MFRKKVLNHLCIKPGAKIELDKWPGCAPSGKAVRYNRQLSWPARGQDEKIATLDEIQQAAADARAGGE